MINLENFVVFADNSNWMFQLSTRCTTPNNSIPNTEKTTSKYEVEKPISSQTKKLKPLHPKI